MIGGNVLDIEADQRAGTRSILVLTGYGETLWCSWSSPVTPDYVARNLIDAVKWIKTSLEEKHQTLQSLPESLLTSATSQARRVTL